MQGIFREIVRTLNTSRGSNWPDHPIIIFLCTLPWWLLALLSQVWLPVFRVSSDVTQHCHLEPPYCENRTCLWDVHTSFRLLMSCIWAQVFALDPFQSYFVSMPVPSSVACWFWSVDFTIRLDYKPASSLRIFSGDHLVFGWICGSTVFLWVLRDCAPCWWGHCPWWLCTLSVPVLPPLQGTLLFLFPEVRNNSNPNTFCLNTYTGKWSRTR